MQKQLQTLFSPKTREGVVGIEFGPEGVAVAHASKRSAHPALDYYAFHTEPRKNEQLSLLKKLITHKNWQGVDCHVVLHPSQYQITMLEAPDVPDCDVRAAMRWSLRDAFGANPDDLAYDVSLLPAGAYRGRGRMATVAAMPRKTMEYIAQNVAQAGLTLQRIDITETAVHNLARQAANVSTPTALLLLRNSSAMLSISEGDVLYFSRSLEIGLNAIKREQEAGNTQQRALDALVLEIQRSLDFFESQLQRDRVTHLYTLPTKLAVPEILAGLAAELAPNTTPFSLGDWLLPEGPHNIREQAYCLGAMGVALRGMSA